MNQALTPKQIFAILTPFILLLIGYFWLLAKANEGPMPLILKPGNQDSVMLPLSTGEIFEFDSNGKLLRQIHVKDLGINEFHGDIAWVNPDEVIIYGGYSGRSFAENLTSFARITPNETQSTQQGLWRCVISQKQCEPFTHELNTMKHTFHMTYDESYEHLYLANTNHHTLYRFNLQGELLSKSQEGQLKFPNQVRIFANQLWVANTNQHKLSYFPLGYDSLDESQGEITIHNLSPCLKTRHPVFNAFSEEPHCFPNALAYVDKEIWLGVAKNNMEEAEIQVFSTTGEFVKTLDLSQAKTTLNLTYDPDPISFVQLGQFVVFSDLNNRAIYRFDLQNKQWSALDIEGVTTKSRASFEDKQTYIYLSYGVIALFVVLVSIGLIIGLQQHLQQQKENKASQPNEHSENHSTLPVPPTNPYWFDKNKKVKRLLFILGGLVLMILALATFIFLELDVKNKLADDSSELPYFVLSFLNIIILFTYVLYTQQSKKLGIAGRLLLVEAAKGKTAIAPLEQSYFVNKRGILVEDVFFPLGTDQLKFLDKMQYKTYLKPRLPQLQTMNEWGYFKYRLANMNQEAWMTLLLTIPMLIMLTLAA